MPMLIVLFVDPSEDEVSTWDRIWRFYVKPLEIDKDSKIEMIKIFEFENLLPKKLLGESKLFKFTQLIDQK